MSYVDRLRELGACEEALIWSEGLTAQKAWDNCERGDWMIWLIAKTMDRKYTIYLACQCARLALKYTTDKRVEDCLIVCEKWCLGAASLEEVRAAGAAAEAAAETATWAAWAAWAANVAANAAANAATAAAWIAWATDGLTTRKECADIIRKYQPNNPLQD